MASARKGKSSQELGGFWHAMREKLDVELERDHPVVVTDERARVLGWCSAYSAMCFGSSALDADGLCAPLRDFVSSVKPGETRALKFHSILEQVQRIDKAQRSAQRCDFDDYGRPRRVKYFMDTAGSVDFAWLQRQSGDHLCISQDAIRAG
jgi:hypothetical protein